MLGRWTNLLQGPLSQTKGTYDFAIEGEGFFMIQTAEGQRLTRAGMFTPNEENVLVTVDGNPVLDHGEAPIAVPAGAQKIDLANDGTLSADGVPFAQVGVFLPADTNELTRAGGTSFAVDGETAPMEVARMIQVQRAYEMGQTYLTAEDERIRAAIETLAVKR